MSRQWHRPAATLGGDGFVVDVGPDQAGWSYSRLRVLRLPPGGRRTLATGREEMAVLPLSGSVSVTVDGKRFDLRGRHSVFAAVTDWAYLPVDAEVELVAEAGAEVALPSAPAERRCDAAYIPAEAVPVEVRGAGAATRQVTNFMAPGVFDGAERLICVEVLTPDGNWSSYPPHRHDGSPGCPVTNEEIYYFRIGRTGTPGYSAEGFGMHRTYVADEGVDEAVAVADGDVFLVPRGFHGPCVASPGYPMYYLNVLAGPGPVRSLEFCDDPAHAWIRDAWAAMPVDPRCPMTSAHGPVRS